MYKYLSPGSFDFDEPVAAIVKQSSRGIHGSDRDGLVKRAGHSFIDEIRNVKMASGEIPVHLIAVGATERYGPNRNGDGFPRSECREHHGTFKKYAKWYRDHKNKDESKGRGIVKLSRFNEEMDRIELLVGLNGTKEAADRNGGLVADRELEALERGDDIAVSMACKIAHDVCSGCGNKARTRKEYCGPQMCKYGGLRDNIGRLFNDGHTLHAVNPRPRFFDISNVFRPADRIAYTLGNLEKAAAAGQTISGAEVAEMIGLRAPYELLSASGKYEKLAADVCRCMEETDLLEKTAASVLASGSASDLPNPPDVFGETTTKFAALTAALADEGIILPVEEFLIVATGGDREKAAAAADDVCEALPVAFASVAEGTNEGNPDSFVMKTAIAPGAYRDWAASIAPRYSFSTPHISRRAQAGVVSGQRVEERPFSKAAAHGQSSAALGLAEMYALYKVASLARMRERSDFPLTLSLSVSQNRVQAA